MSGVQRIGSRDEFDRFAEDLRRSDRRPIVVASIEEGREEPYIDVEKVAEELQGTVDVFVLEPRATYWLSDLLGGPSFSAFSGWGRIYPAKGSWTNDFTLSPRFRANPRNGHLVAADIINEALKIAYDEGSLAMPSAGAPTGELVNATVRSVATGTQAFVEVGGGRQAVLRTSAIYPGVPAERLLAKGMELKGTYEHVGLLGEFTPEPIEDDVDARLREYVGEGISTLALVEDVSSGRAEVRVHPRLPLMYVKANDGSNVRHLVTKGEVVAVEVVSVGDEYAIAFADGDAEDELAPAISVLPLGPPWLVPDPPVRQAVGGGVGDGYGAPADFDVVVEPRSSSTASHGELEFLQSYVRELEADLEAERSRAREMGAELRRQKKVSIPVVFSNPEEQFRLEARLAYLTTVGEDERHRYPWREDYVLGGEFLETVAEQVRSGGISREKVVKVCAEVVSGKAKDLRVRSVKPWNESRRGNQIIRKDGAAAMRVALQRNTPSARRMKFWQLGDGQVELDSVGVHDDGLSG